MFGKVVRAFLVVITSYVDECVVCCLFEQRLKIKIKIFKKWRIAVKKKERQSQRFHRIRPVQTKVK